MTSTLKKLREAQDAIAKDTLAFAKIVGCAKKIEQAPDKMAVLLTYTTAIVNHAKAGIRLHKALGHIDDPLTVSRDFPTADQLENHWNRRSGDKAVA